jgi:hypothetical protein
MTSYENDENSKEMVAKLTLDLDAVPDFTLSQGLLRYKSRIWVG